jgi:hypothetical protein
LTTSRDVPALIVHGNYGRVQSLPFPQIRNLQVESVPEKHYFFHFASSSIFCPLFNLDHLNFCAPPSKMT